MMIWPAKTKGMWENIDIKLSLRELPIEERLELVEELWDSIETDQQSSREHIAVLDKRLASLNSDAASAKPTRSTLLQMKQRL